MLQVPQYILDEAVSSGCGSKVRNNFCRISQLNTAFLPTFDKGERGVYAAASGGRYRSGGARRC